MKVDLSYCPSPHSLGNRLGRTLWSIVWLVFFRPTPRICHKWRRLLLRLFGAKIGRGVHVHSSARIWAPWNIQMGDHSCIGPEVDCYSVAPILIGPHATISQYCFLCTASHDIEQPQLPLVTSPIKIGEGAWVAADAFIGPGVKVGEGAVVGARSNVLRDVAAWTVVGGNPARFLKQRVLKEAA